jgi:hypothetical protein
MLLPGNGRHFKVTGRGGIPKGLSGCQTQKVIDYKAMHRDNPWVVFDEAKGTSDVVVTQEDRRIRVSDAEIPNPPQEPKEGS